MILEDIAEGVEGIATVATEERGNRREGVRV